ncbi:conserved hypothetical protein [uncultured Pleomorphomonas sp.]|uniref:DUF2934 domain-containing protein n=2 Tax=Pleomorphomonas TaxID=261933 RepID=A0A2G9WTF1_9HYPH|nr:DUF2934 domain-containing protein [Pleomorphomonas carboxyditropha]PIO97955.1 hypothetical protein CJ014_17680 [Pleomorphomonas carboxyditropha]SCM76943.1 conserved hypothetical protein [uncultured Pleomorphomonas sp.]
MPNIDETWVRNRAHELWEKEGCPEGKELDHWFQAMDEYLSLVERDEESPPGDPIVAQNTDNGEAPVKRRPRSSGKATE